VTAELLHCTALPYLKLINHSENISKSSSARAMPRTYHFVQRMQHARCIMPIKNTHQHSRTVSAESFKKRSGWDLILSIPFK